MRIFKALFFLPDFFGQLMPHKLTDCVKAWCLIDYLAVTDNGNLEGFGRAVCIVTETPRFLGIDIAEGRRKVNRFTLAGNEITKGLAIAVIDTVQVLPARIRNLFNGFRNLDARRPGLVLVFDSNQLINRTEDRIAFSGNEAFTNAKGIDASALIKDGPNGIFIKAV